ncbi:hypothetical protein WMY93_017782 [Mugilogobius chulae]|uniref:Uncharacterized protein n=1 Tax=Mugilogobius chulae TaxID=88201 RepID=A0AAW0NP60_9GOBI
MRGGGRARAGSPLSPVLPATHVSPQGVCSSPASPAAFLSDSSALMVIRKPVSVRISAQPKENTQPLSSSTIEEAVKIVTKPSTLGLTVTTRWFLLLPLKNVDLCELSQDWTRYRASSEQRSSEHLQAKCCCLSDSLQWSHVCCLQASSGAHFRVSAPRWRSDFFTSPSQKLRKVHATRENCRFNIESAYDAKDEITESTGSSKSDIVAKNDLPENTEDDDANMLKEAELTLPVGEEDQLTTAKAIMGLTNTIQR